jgi:hypothetical protein
MTSPVDCGFPVGSTRDVAIEAHFCPAPQARPTCSPYASVRSGPPTAEAEIHMATTSIWEIVWQNLEIVMRFRVYHVLMNLICFWRLISQSEMIWPSGVFPI